VGDFEEKIAGIQGELVLLEENAKNHIRNFEGREDRG
jgi:hypothetical protein